MKLKIKDIGNVVTGKTPSTSDKANFGKGYLFITPKELHTDTGIIHSSERQLTQKGFESIRNNTIFGLSVLVGCIGSDMGNVALVDQKCATNQQINAITNINPKICNPYYLYYWLRIQKKYLFKIANATTTPILKKSDFENIEIDFPKINIQNNIVKFLRTIDLKIANNNAISKELESISKTIYDYWFLQFEFPNKDGKPYKSNGGKMVWNDQLKQEIPERWKVGTIEDLGEITSGGTPSTKEKDYYSKTGIAWLTPNDLSNSHNKYITHGERDITEEGLKNSSARLMPKGTVLLTSRAPIGYLGIAVNEVTTNQGFKSIVPKKKFGSEYIYHTLNNLIPYLKSVGTGSTFIEISKTVLKDVKIPIPSESVVSYFEKIVSSMGTKHRINEAENQQLQSLRDFILPMLMNGQVTIDD